MKELMFIVLSIGGLSESKMKTCTAVEITSKDTGTLFIQKSNLHVGDTIVITKR
jgi:hypothetical protein